MKGSTKIGEEMGEKTRHDTTRLMKGEEGSVMVTYLCYEDGVDALVFGGDGGGQTLNNCDVVELLVRQLLAHLGMGFHGENAEAFGPECEGLRQLARPGGEVDEADSGVETDGPGSLEQSRHGLIRIGRAMLVVEGSFSKAGNGPVADDLRISHI